MRPKTLKTDRLEAGPTRVLGCTLRDSNKTDVWDRHLAGPMTGWKPVPHVLLEVLRMHPKTLKGDRLEAGPTRVLGCTLTMAGPIWWRPHILPLTLLRRARDMECGQRQRLAM